MVLGLFLASACYAQSPSPSPSVENTTVTDTAAPASLAGVTRGPGGKPIPSTDVVISGMDDGTNRVVISDSQGSFEISGLPPGHYQLKANKEGFVNSPGSTVELAPGQSLHVELALLEGSAVPVLPATAPKGGFFRRFIQAYADDWKGTEASGPEAKYRGYPAPVTNPPYPFAVWPIGGTPWIGYPGATSYPLTTALQTGPHGDW